MAPRATVTAAGVAAVLALACGGSERPDPPDLAGTWVFDQPRIMELYEVSVTPEGPERERAIERAMQHHTALRIEFTEEEATLHTAHARRTLPYRIRGWHGTVVELEGVQGDTVVASTLKVHGNKLTWFDRDGEIEFVLRRDADP